MPEINDLPLTVDQVAMLVQSTGERIRNLAKAGKIPFHQEKPRGAISIMHSDVEKVRQALAEAPTRTKKADVLDDILRRLEALEQHCLGHAECGVATPAPDADPVTVAADEAAMTAAANAIDDLPF